MGLMRKIDELLSDESKWTKGTNALDYKHAGVHSVSPFACCWCLLGAFIKCNVGDQSQLSPNKLPNGKPNGGAILLQAIAETSEFEYRTMWSFNDDPRTDFTKVKAALKRAIELEEAA